MNLVGTGSVSEDGESIVTNNESDDGVFLGEYGVDSPGTYIVIATGGDQGITGGPGDRRRTVTPVAGLSSTRAPASSSESRTPKATSHCPRTIGSTTLYVSDPETGGYANVYVAVGETLSQVEIQLTVPETIATGLVNGASTRSSSRAMP